MDSLKRMDNARFYVICCVILVALCVIYCFPWLYVKGIIHFKSQDTYFHFNRFISLQNVWKAPVNFHSFCNNGPMTNIFYPWLTIYPVRILLLVTKSYVAAYKLYRLMLTLCTALVSFYVGIRLFNRSENAFCFAVLYTFSSYRFADLFRRSAVGESVALVFLPLVLLGLINIIWRDFTKWMTLSIGMALVAYSHVLTLFMTSFVIAVVSIGTFSMWTYRWKRLTSLVKAAVLSFALSAAFIAPLIQQFLTNDIFQPEGSGEGLGETAYGLGDIAIKSLNNIPAQHHIGILVFVALLTSIFIILNSWLKKIDVTDERSSSAEENVARWMIIFGGLFFWGTSSLLPWRLIGKYTPLKVIQFTWRFNTFITLFVAAGAAWIIPNLFQRKKQKEIFLTLLCLTAISLHYSQTDALLHSEHEIVMDKDILNFEDVHFDYAPAKAAEYRQEQGYFMDQFLLNGKEFEVQTEVSADGTSYYIFPDKQPSDAVLDIPVFWYSTQQAKLNGQKIRTSMSERGTTLISLPPKMDVVVEIYYEYTRLTRVCWGFSMITALITFAYIIWKTYHQEVNAS